MNANMKKLRGIGQSIWLDSISRELLVNGGLARYIDEFSVTGLTSNPTIFEHAIAHGNFYDSAIVDVHDSSKSAEDVFFALALQDLTQAADLFRATHDATECIDGWVSLEVSPLLADSTTKTIDAAERLHQEADRPNLFIKIPGTPAGVDAIEESIFKGVPINVTLLFSREQYVRAAEAYMRALERRRDAGLDLHVSSVASLFVSRWDVAVKDRVPTSLHNRLGIAIAAHTFEAYGGLLKSQRWKALADAGARPQRLLWASTGTKDPAASDTLYIEALAVSDTINTIPEKTLHAFADHGEIATTIPIMHIDAESVLEEFKSNGVKLDSLATRLQREGTDAFTHSWRALLARIDQKRSDLSETGA